MRRGLGIALVLAGLLVLADVAVTLAWQEPLSAWRAEGRQARLAGELRRLEPAAPRAATRAGEAAAVTGPARAQLAAAARAFARTRAAGYAVAGLRIPRLGLRTVVVRGTAADDLRSGPGLLDGTPFPGAGGTTAIAGHRTTYGAPFRDLDALRRGDAIVLRLPYATFRYAVEGTRIVAPGDLAVLRRVGHDRLVLSACHPLFSAARRIVVVGRLIWVGHTANSLNRDV